MVLGKGCCIRAAVIIGGYLMLTYYYVPSLPTSLHKKMKWTNSEE